MIMPITSLLARRFIMSEDQAFRHNYSLGIESDLGLGKAILTFSAAKRDCGSFDSLSYTEWPCNIPLQFVLSLDRSPLIGDHWINIMHDICCSIPWSNVQSLHVRDIDIPELGSVLSITPCDCMENQGEEVARAQRKIFVPELEELGLHDIVFLTVPEEDMDPLKVAETQTLCDALATRKGPRGRLTMTQCTIRNADGQRKYFDMEGRWEGGCFHVVDLKL
ncbi:hypothetical protein OG21DRAFT_912379 [Imleria badia]|nr:hypothetical protein OG21DRAFT_912379 [Imleria badia]